MKKEFNPDIMKAEAELKNKTKRMSKDQNVFQRIRTIEEGEDSYHANKVHVLGKTHF